MNFLYDEPMKLHTTFRTGGPAGRFCSVASEEELMEVLGENRQVSVSREISKVHAETARGTLREVRDHFASKEVKGEIVVVLSGEPAFDEEEVQ